MPLMGWPARARFRDAGFGGAEHLLKRLRNDLADAFDFSDIVFGFDGHVTFRLSRKRRAAPSFLAPRGGRAGRSPALGVLNT